MLMMGVFCFLVAWMVTPLVIKFAHFTKAVDQPNERKVHAKVMPRLGGLAIWIAFLLGYMVFRAKQFAINEAELKFIEAYFISSFIIVGTGMLDDMYELPPYPKMMMQFIVAMIMVVYGEFVIDFVHLPFIPPIELGWMGGILTILWIIGATNAINLIDGLDGLAAGLSSISFATMILLAVANGDWFVTVLCCLLLGSTLGFLIHNFYPAKIFMGDTGSLFLGFSVSVFSLLGYKNAAFVSFIVPIVLLSVPLFDTTWAIIRRLLKGQSPFKADRGHVHHCLLDRQLGHQKSVCILYCIAALFSMTGIVYSLISKFFGLTLMVVGMVIVELIFNTTGFFRMKLPKESKATTSRKVQNKNQVG